MNVYELLKKRGYIAQVSNEEGIKKLLAKPGTTIYEGFDPTAKSLHIGQLSNILALYHLQQAGHKIIFLVGGGTGLIGDPTDKEHTRPMLTEKEIEENTKALKKQAKNLMISFSGKNPARVINNAEWISKANLKDYMRNIAAKISLNDLLKLETFKKRLDNNQHLSLMEIMYPSLQAWDFLHLFKKHNCKLQIGGSDQWANIISGVKLIRNTHQEEVFALTMPLITDASGQKMGKTSAGEKIWLDPEMTSAYDCYQYLQAVDDKSVPELLKRLTLLPLEVIKKVTKNPREAQKKLAYEVTKLLHGEEKAKEADKKSEKVFAQPAGATKQEAISITKDLTLSLESEISEILQKVNLIDSNSQLKRLISQEGIRLNSRVPETHKDKISNFFQDQEIIRVEKGKQDALLLTK